MRKKKVAAGIVISNNTMQFKMEPFVLDPQMAASFIQKLSQLLKHAQATHERFRS